MKQSIIDALLVEIERLAPDMVIVSGDLTMHCLGREWRAARSFLDSLTVPYMVIPGNHDMPYINLFERFTDPFAKFRRYISEELNPTFHDAELAIMGINTSRPWVPHWNWKEGDIDGGQVRMMDRFFRPMRGRPLFRVVFTHHPFLPPPWAPHTYLVRHARRALQVMEQLEIDLLLAGHLHLRYSGPVTSHHTFIKRRILVAQAGTATSRRLRQGHANGYNLLAIESDRLQIRSWEWDGCQYAQVEVSHFDRVPDGWAARESATPVEED